VEALVNKQKGFDWSWFQVAKQSDRFGIFTINLINQTPKDFKQKYAKSLTKLSLDYKDYRDGHQLFLVVISYFIQFGHFPLKDKVKSLFRDNSNIPISKSAFELVCKYAKEYLTTLGDAKTTISPLINYVLFRQLMDGKKFDSHFVNTVKLPTNYIIKKEKAFVDYFIKTHLEMYNKKNKHDASFVLDANGIKVPNKTGYNASCGAQDDENIYRRINILIKYFDFDKLVNDGILQEVENVNMPSQIDVAIYNDWEDVEGNIIKISDLPDLDRSHFESKKNKGSNELSNLGLENSKKNRSRQEENLQRK
jgi:hypothetical protein